MSKSYALLLPKILQKTFEYNYCDFIEINYSSDISPQIIVEKYITL